jgi:hypothetical protein
MSLRVAIDAEQSLHPFTPTSDRPVSEQLAPYEGHWARVLASVHVKELSAYLIYISQDATQRVMQLQELMARSKPGEPEFVKLAMHLSETAEFVHIHTGHARGCISVSMRGLSPCSSLARSLACSCA